MQRLIWTTAASALLIAAGGVSRADTFAYNSKIAGEFTAVHWKNATDTTSEILKLEAAMKGTGVSNVTGDTIGLMMDLGSGQLDNASVLFTDTDERWFPELYLINSTNLSPLMNLNASFGSKGPDGFGALNAIDSDLGLGYAFTQDRLLVHKEYISGNISNFNTRIADNEKKILGLEAKPEVMNFRKADLGFGIRQDIEAFIASKQPWTAEIVAGFNTRLVAAYYANLLSLGAKNEILGLQALNTEFNEFVPKLEDFRQIAKDLLIQINDLQALVNSDKLQVAALGVQLAGYDSMVFDSKGRNFRNISDLTADYATSRFDYNKSEAHLGFGLNTISDYVVLNEIRIKFRRDIKEIVGGNITVISTTRPTDDRVPEPASLALAGVGVLGVIARRRTRRG